MTLRVLGRTTSINVRKVLWTADELRLAYEREDWGKPLRDPHEPEFLALNPNAQVPVIVEDGFVLWESHAIMRYLAETHPSGGLLPADARERAVVDQWLTWQATELNPTWNYAFRALARKLPGYDDPARVAESSRRWAEKMAILEAQLQGTGAFAAGDVFSLADISLGLSVHRWFKTPIERPELPAVAAYYERLGARSHGATWMPPDVA